MASNVSTKQTPNASSFQTHDNAFNRVTVNFDSKGKVVGGTHTQTELLSIPYEDPMFVDRFTRMSPADASSFCTKNGECSRFQTMLQESLKSKS